MTNPKIEDINQDVEVIRQVYDALKKSTSKRMMRANLRYIIDTFLENPPQDLTDYWKKKEVTQEATDAS